MALRCRRVGAVHSIIRVVLSCPRNVRFGSNFRHKPDRLQPEARERACRKTPVTSQGAPSRQSIRAYVETVRLPCLDGVEHFLDHVVRDLGAATWMPSES